MGWVLPAQWAQRVSYPSFTVDLFFLESNFFDAKPRGQDPHHNICEGGDPPGTPCYGITPASCPGWFRANWDKSLDFLKRGVAVSDATWKVVVTHYPGGTIAPMIATMANKIDLLFTGHTHWQSLGSSSGIDWIISGGGGGITSDAVPSSSGEDGAYGFVDITVSRSSMKMDMYSWGGPSPGRSILRNT